MEALVFDGNTKKLQYRSDYPVPKIRDDTDVLIKVAYSGFCGTDLHIIQVKPVADVGPTPTNVSYLFDSNFVDAGRLNAHLSDLSESSQDLQGPLDGQGKSGKYDIFVEGEFPVITSKPLVLGHEFSGVVQEAGAKSKFKKGQRVVVDPNGACSLCDWCRRGDYNHCEARGKNTRVGTWVDGGFAHYVVMPDTNVYELPGKVTLEQGGLCEPYSCVSHGFDRVSPLSVGSKILIVGAGIIGNMWVTTLHLHGHRDVTVSEMNPKRLNVIKNLETGYRLVSPDVLEQEKLLFDVIIDCTGVGRVMETSFHYLNPGGKYVIFGCCPPDHVARVNPFEIYNKELTLIGVKVNPFSFNKALNWLKAMGDRYLNYGKLGVRVYSLSQYQQAIDDLRSGSISKAMFKIE